VVVSASNPRKDGFTTYFAACTTILSKKTPGFDSTPDATCKQDTNSVCFKDMNNAVSSVLQPDGSVSRKRWLSL